MSNATEETIAASAAAYKSLAALELEFDKADVELLKHQIRIFTPLYTRRSTVLQTIPNFWRAIFETAGPELDEHILPEDWAFLGENLLSLDIERPFPEDNPRSFDVVLTFKKDNGWIKETELRKRFEYKSMNAGEERWSGLVSEPVVVEWVDEKKDLTNGIGKLAKEVYDDKKKQLEDRIKNGKSDKKGKGPSEKEKQLEEKVAQGVSFFVWFSWIGEAFMVLEESLRAERDKDLSPEEREKKHAKEDEENEDEDDDMVDVFPDGDKLAYLFAEDLFPNALKHFTDAMESEEGMDLDDYSGDESNDGSIDLGSDEEAAEAALKKKKRVKSEESPKKSKKVKTEA